MARLGVSKKKKSPRATDLSQLKKEVQRLTEQLESRDRELAEASEREGATGNILRVISSSPNDLQPVLDVVAENAARLCAANDALMLRVEGDILRLMASYGSLPTSQTRPIKRQLVSGRAVIDRQTIHVHDITAAEDEFPVARTRGMPRGIRTFLATPLLRQGVPIGVIAIRRTEVRPFSDKQISLFKTFADQAVIAIENVRLFQELKEALEQQTATSEILGVIASSPTDIQPVLDAIAQNAARVCGSDDATIRLLEGDETILAAHYGTIPPNHPERRPMAWRTVGNEALLQRRTIHIADVLAEVEKFPDSIRGTNPSGTRTFLVTPLLREGTAIGVINIRRTEVQPFTDKQVALLETFASQAVIAIENVRLFKEIQERNAELREALEHQTATSEVLGIISRSPTDVQPVLDAIVESAARVCGIDDVLLRLREGDMIVARAHFGPVSIATGREEISIDRPQFRWIRERGTLHIPDVQAAQNEFPRFGITSGFRSFLAAPLNLQEEFIGGLFARRTEVRPFTPAQIKLLETFADQAAIAIENVRLFNELKESLAQQTATSEILGVIASSPTDIQPVLDAIAQSAARVCGSDDATIRRTEEDTLFLVAHYGTIPPGLARRPLASRTPNNEAILQRKTVHIFDVLTEAERFPDSSWVRDPHDPRGIRTFLVTPLLREGVPIGVIVIRRTEVQPFTDKQVELLEAFAAQAVIAIENGRLFKELESRNAELREALEHQTATSEVLGIISRSPTDVQPVLDAIVESAAQVCGIDDVVLRLREGNSLVWRAHFGPMPITRLEVSTDEPQFRWIREYGTLHVPDAREQNDFPTLGAISGTRTFLFAPLRQQGELVATLDARRTEVRPFTPAQIKLLETFADQAVIAIENVRLFQELKESLEQQTATSEILGVIASSPTDIQPVLDVVAENAARDRKSTRLNS